MAEPPRRLATYADLAVLPEGTRAEVVAGEFGVYDDSATARVAPFEAIELPVGRLFLPRGADGG